MNVTARGASTADRPGWREVEARLPVKVHCHAAGCRNTRPIAEIVGESVVVRDNGRSHVVLETTCPKCGTPRSFRDLVPN